MDQCCSGASFKRHSCFIHIRKTLPVSEVTSRGCNVEHYGKGLLSDRNQGLHAVIILYALHSAYSSNKLAVRRPGNNVAFNMLEDLPLPPQGTGISGPVERRVWNRDGAVGDEQIYMTQKSTLTQLVSHACLFFCISRLNTIPLNRLNRKLE